MGIIQNLYQKVSKNMSKMSAKNETVEEYLKEKIQLKSEETVNDQNRLYRFRNYILEIEDELEKDSLFKIEYYNATILGVDAIAFLDIDEYNEKKEKAMPLYIVSPLFVYAPDVDKMIYMREGDSDDISELLNYQMDWKLNANTHSRSDKNDDNLENIKTSLEDFKRIILPLIQKTMVDDSEQDKKLARKSILQTESDKVKKYVEKAINLEEAEHELNLKQLQYQEDSLDFERKVEKYNQNVKSFQTKLAELKEGIAYLKDRETALIQLSNTVEDLENKKSIIPQEKLEEIQQLMQKMVKQYQQDSILAITNKLQEVNNSSDKEELKNHLNETIDSILESYKDMNFESNDIQDNEVLEMTINYLEVNKDELITPIVEEASKLNKPFKLETYHNVAIMSSIRDVQDAYKSVNGIQESDMDVLKNLCNFLKQLNTLEPITIVKNYSNEGCLIFRKEINNETNLYVLSPVLFGNVTTQEYYAGYDIENDAKNNTENSRIKDEQFFGKLISYITAHYLSRSNQKELVRKEIGEPKDSNWTNKLLNAQAYLKLNTNLHTKIEQLGVKVGFGKGKIPLNNREIYTGNVIAYSGANGILYILPAKIVLQDKENKYQAVNYETIIELAGILANNDKYSKFLVNNPKINLSDKKLIQTLFTPLLSGLDLRGNYVKRLNQKEKERV